MGPWDMTPGYGRRRNPFIHAGSSRRQRARTGASIVRSFQSSPYLRNEASVRALFVPEHPLYPGASSEHSHSEYQNPWYVFDCQGTSLRPLCRAQPRCSLPSAVAGADWLSRLMPRPLPSTLRVLPEFPGLPSHSKGGLVAPELPPLRLTGTQAVRRHAGPS